MTRGALTLVVLTCACGGSGGQGTGGETAVERLAPGCIEMGLPPATLACTGLYTDVMAKRLAPGVEPFSPAVPLWADGADKERWIRLPPGTTVDASNPSEWSFPEGTKLWKQFSRDGRRIETRLWQKVRDGFWVDATYAWNDDQSAADRSNGGDIPLGQGTYHIPTQDECEKCHRGRTDRLLEESRAKSEKHAGMLRALWTDFWTVWRFVRAWRDGPDGPGLGRHLRVEPAADLRLGQGLQ